MQLLLFPDQFSTRKKCTDTFGGTLLTCRKRPLLVPVAVSDCPEASLIVYYRTLLQLLDKELCCNMLVQVGLAVQQHG